MKNKIPKQIIIILALAVILNIARVVLFDSTYFLFILWNIFLAILPFVISTILLYYANKQKLSKLFFIIIGIFWLLLIPNAPYLLTDLIHISSRHGAPVLYDAFLLFSSAYIGLLLGLYSIWHIEQITIMKYGKRIASIKIPVIIFIISIGVYIGRYLRFNSWDIFVNHSLLGDTLNALSRPTHQNEAVIFIFSCFLVLYMSYRAWKYNQNNMI